MSTTRLAVDVGGTFTDVVRLDADDTLRVEKVPTTPLEPTRGVIDSIARAQAPLPDVAVFSHGTTLGLNALLTRTGAPTAIVATEGFRDVYLLGRTARDTNYNILYRKPKALLERSDTFEVRERMLYDGSVHVAFDEESARATAALVRDGAYQSVAVAFLHAYANPTHEQAMRDVLNEVAPDVEVSLSSDLSREYREYERTSTAVLDAYIKPIVRTYLADLQGEIADGGFGGQFLIMRSSGGAMTADSALDQPVNVILSGPAGGVIGAAGFAELVGEPNLITIDMGGTSLDASLIIDGHPVLHQGAEFEGLPINTSSLYIHTIGAGGGSIAWIDEAGGLQVGPQSAGADPGPASYGAGGTLPTFTDAALVMGYLGDETPLAGTLTLDETLARQALEPLAGQMGMSVEAFARGVVQISTTKIVGAVRSITIELGRDPKDFALLAFGGGGGLVGVDVARDLGMTKVIIPPGQGAFSALGMLMADVQHDFARTSVMPLESLDEQGIDEVYAVMAAEAQTNLANEGFAEDHQTYARSVDVRYTGQEHTVSVGLPSDVSQPVKYLSDKFAELHALQYGHTMTDPVQLTTFRLRATGHADKPALPRLATRSEGAPTPIGERETFAGDDQPGATTKLYPREELQAGDEIAGPAVIVEHTATTVLHRGDHLVVGPHGELVITLEESPYSGGAPMIDAITTEIIRHGLLSACEEMARNLCRTSYNTVVYEIHDYGIGLHDADGNIVADAPGIAVFTRGNDYGIKRSIEFLGAENMKPGDVFMNNYPYWSSAHTLDPLVFAPIHDGDKLIGFASCRVHVLDLKQKDPGYVLDSVDMYQEGIFFPVVRLYRGGEIQEDIFNIIKFNSRLPNHTIGDIQAEVSAVFTGVRRTAEIVNKYGSAALTEAMNAINDHGERLARAALARMPKGTWSAEDFVDHDGVDLDQLVKMAVTITITDDEMIVDWTDSADGVRGPINLPRGMTEAFNCLIFKALTTPDWPVTAGNFRPLRIITKEGSVMHAVPPMPTFTLWTGLLGGEVMLKALAKGMPDRVPACSGGDVCSVMALGIKPDTGDPWLEATNDAVGFGAHAGGDGEDGIMHLTEPGCRNNPVEVLEVKGPMIIESYGYRPDSGGPGKHRGGVGVSRVYRFLEPTTAISILYKTKSAPWAINGGTEGDPNHIVINPGDDEIVKGGSYNLLEADTVLANNTGGGGGWGNPFERDPSQVSDDVRNGLVSLDAAERDYGVAVDPATFEVDQDRTDELRLAAQPA